MAESNKFQNMIEGAAKSANAFLLDAGNVTSAWRTDHKDHSPPFEFEYRGHTRVIRPFTGHVPQNDPQLIEAIKCSIDWMEEKRQGEPYLSYDDRHQGPVVHIDLDRSINGTYFITYRLDQTKLLAIPREVIEEQKRWKRDADGLLPKELMDEFNLVSISGADASNEIYEHARYGDYRGFTVPIDYGINEHALKPNEIMLRDGSTVDRVEAEGVMRTLLCIGYGNSMYTPDILTELYRMAHHGVSRNPRHVPFVTEGLCKKIAHMSYDRTEPGEPPFPEQQNIDTSPLFADGGELKPVAKQIIKNALISDPEYHSSYWVTGVHSPLLQAHGAEFKVLAQRGTFFSEKNRSIIGKALADPLLETYTTSRQSERDEILARS